MLRIVASEQPEQDALKLDLDALVREGARRMLLAALTAEVDEYLTQHADQRDDAGHALVVRNGVAEPRTVTTAAGELEIQAPVSTIGGQVIGSPAPSRRPGHAARPK
jgi:transposase-like protein